MSFHLVAHLQGLVRWWLKDQLLSIALLYCVILLCYNILSYLGQPSTMRNNNNNNNNGYF